MAIKVFLLGRPGSGKTSAFYILEKIARKKKKKAIRFREYTILREMIHQDGFKNNFRFVEFGGLDILDFSVFNESARRLEQQIQSYLSTSNENELIFIELARDDYSQAMNCFSREFLQDAYFLFTEADVETCINRIHYRVAHPRKTDGHYVSDYIVKSYYNTNNLPYMSYKFRLEYAIQKQVIVIENTDSPQKFAMMIKYYTKTIFVREFSNTKETVTREFSNTKETGLNPLLVLMFSLITFPMVILAIPTFIPIIHLLTEIPLFIYFLGIIIFVLLCSKRYILGLWMYWLHRPSVQKTSSLRSTDPT